MEPTDPLYNLAVQAGLFPDNALPGVGDMYSGDIVPPSQPYGVPQESGGFMQGGLTPPEVPAEYAEPTVPNVQLPTTLKAGQSVGMGQSQSYGGFSPTQYGAVSKADADLYRQYGIAEQTANESGQGLLDANRVYTDKAAAAQEAVNEATTEQVTAAGHQASFMQQLQDGFATDEMAENMKAKAAGDQAKAEYLAAIADLRASKVNPAQLWDNMSGGGKFGMLVTAFVHDFLGVKGIKTSAMDTLNKAIDRNIDAQIQGIKTKGEVAEGFKSLYYMQRNQSASDAEARARVRGFLLEGAKQHVIANMAKYEAGLATAQGQQAIAAIDKEFLKNYVDIQKHIDSNVVALKNQALDLHKAKLHASVQNYATSVQARMAALAEKKYEDEKNAAGGYEESDYIFNPETNKGEWVFKRGKDVTAPIKKEVKDRIIGIAEVNKAVGELRELNRKLPAGFDATQGTRLSNEDERKYEAIRLRLAHAMVKANGERATEQDVQQYLKSLPRSTWFTNGGVDSILGYTQKAALEPGYEYIRQYANDVPQAHQPTGATGMPFAGAYTDAKNVASGEANRTTHDQNLRVNAEKQLGGPAALAAHDATEAGADVRKTFGQFQSKYVEQATALANEAKYKPGEVPGVVKGVAELTRIAKTGGPEAQRAIDVLKHSADSFLRGVPGSDTDWLGALSAMALSDLQKEAPVTSPSQSGQ
jgi:hypothetical protein